jgi:hypothetical protein
MLINTSYFVSTNISSTIINALTYQQGPLTLIIMLQLLFATSYRANSFSIAFIEIHIAHWFRRYHIANLINS